MSNSNDFLQVGKINGPHGLDGKVHVRLFNPDSHCLSPGLKVELRSPDCKGGGIQPVTVACVALLSHKRLFRTEFVEIKTRNAAETIRGFFLWVHRSQLEPLAHDEFYLADAIGLAVERTRADGTQQVLGHVIAISSNGAQDLLEIAWDSPEKRRYLWLLPVLPQFIDEMNETKIHVQVPLGFLPEPLEHED